MKITNVYLILIVLLMSSCHGKRLSVKNFAPIDDFSELNGRYTNEENRLSNALKIYNSEVDIDILDLNFKTKDSLIISYIDAAGYKQVGLKGKKKKNFFQIYFRNIRIYLPPVFVMNQIERIRIGKDKDEKLLIYRWDEYYGIVMPLGAGGSASDEYQQSYSRYTTEGKEALYAFQVGEKWGYKDKKDSMVIAPVYDYAQPFKNGVAKVARNKQWGFINTRNEEIIPLAYDTIMKPEGDIIRVCKGGKWGLIDSLNNVIAPFKYDRILAFQCWKHTDPPLPYLAEVRKEDKMGFINKQGTEIIPAEYDKMELQSVIYGTGYSKYFRTQSGDKYGYASGYGVLCKPVFDKARKRLFYNGFSYRNKTLADKIGKYSEVIYKGEPYLFTERGILYKYQKLGFFKEHRLVVDFNSRFRLKEE